MSAGPEKADAVLTLITTVAPLFDAVKKVWLYGSRANHTHSPVSDYDLAVEWVGKENQSWGTFAELLREKNPTLNALDLVRIDQIGDSLKNRVLTEGVLIYEKNRADSLHP